MTTPNKFHRSAVRSAAISAMRAAHPTATGTEIANALGLSRSTVSFHLDGHVKARPAPTWFGELATACAHLCAGRNKRAADAFAKLAEGLSVRRPEENNQASECA